MPIITYVEFGGQEHVVDVANGRAKNHDLISRNEIEWLQRQASLVECTFARNDIQEPVFLREDHNA